MTGKAHKMGGETATLLTMILAMVLMKVLPPVQQLGLFLLTYPCVRWICDLTCLLADTDANIENIPVRNTFGYVMFGLAKQLGVTHRGAPIHAMQTYIYLCGVPSLIIVVMYFMQPTLFLYATAVCLFAIFTGFMSHILLDGLTVSGVYKDMKGANKLWLYKIVKQYTRVFKYTQLLGIIPLLTFKKEHQLGSERTSGSEFEKIWKDNIYNINRWLFKWSLLLFVVDFRALFTALRFYLINI